MSISLVNLKTINIKIILATLASYNAQQWQSLLKVYSLATGEA